MAASGEVRRRLLDMGISSGVCLKVLRVAPLGNPIEIFVKGFNLSLRLEEAQYIFVKKIGEVGDHKPMGCGCKKGRGGFCHGKK